MTTYTRLARGGIRRDLDGAQIPPDEGNRDYLQYLDDVNGGAVVFIQPDQPQAADPAAMADVGAEGIGLLIQKGVLKLSDFSPKSQTIIAQRSK